MLKIDAHQHFWKFNPLRDSWITNDMKVIQRDFLPLHFKPVLQANRIDGCVAVQSDQSNVETMFLISNALENEFIKGVVGWVDLRAKGIEDELAYLSNFKPLKGFRHILQGEKDRALMLKKKFMNGVSFLAKYNLTYDILILPDQLKYAFDLAKKFPNQKFVIDHVAKPLIKAGDIKTWEKDIRSFKKLDNVFCKISGLVTEADWKNWKQKNFIPYLDVVVETFGMNRLMYGSDWPVCLVAATYKKTKNICEVYFQNFSDDEKEAFWGGNATGFYSL